MHVDRLTWGKNLKTEKSPVQPKKEINARDTRKFILLIENKLQLYKAVLKPLWTYGFQLLGTA
jgi:hypothetical protein